VIGIFRRTHVLTATGFGIVQWQRTDLPGPGTLADQDAWLMAALEHVRHEFNALTLETLKDRPKTKDRGQR
jgi:hypothetical protein